VHPELADRRIDRGHLGRFQHRDLDVVLGGQDVELARVQQQLAVAGLQRLPEVARIVAVLVVQVDDAGMATAAEADDAALARRQVDADALDRQLDRLAALQAQLVQARARRTSTEKVWGAISI
jgi:hypothetical protein